MLNLLYGYIENSLPEGSLATAPGLRVKVDDAGRFLPFVGNTVVFLLNDAEKASLSALQDSLYAAAGHMLSQRLRPDTFHMTLHDLANGAPGEKTGSWMQEAEPIARDILADIKEKDLSPIAMRGTWMFNMVNTSIVLGLAPVDSEGETRLSRMYEALHTAVPLNYALTPHITLAYFKPGVYSGKEFETLRSTLKPADISVKLDMNKLVLQHFEDMNHYITPQKQET